MVLLEGSYFKFHLFCVKLCLRIVQRLDSESKCSKILFSYGKNNTCSHRYFCWVPFRVFSRLCLFCSTFLSISSCDRLKTRLTNCSSLNLHGENANVDETLSSYGRNTRCLNLFTGVAMFLPVHFCMFCQILMYSFLDRKRFFENLLKTVPLYPSIIFFLPTQSLFLAPTILFHRRLIVYAGHCMYIVRTWISATITVVISTLWIAKKNLMIFFFLSFYWIDCYCQLVYFFEWYLSQLSRLSPNRTTILLDDVHLNFSYNS